MAASRDDIRGWWAQGKREGATHLIIVCDTYDHDDYPVFVKPGQDVRKVADEYNGKNMQRVMEVYSYNHDRDAQLAEHRAFHYD
jgi:hypothetical protein